MANRKLQVEIERTMKKIGEGIEAFDDIWENVYSASNANQKEKYETDLKKEIKKLQRYRDSLKQWINSSDIKDKSELIDARKNIERQMERFKQCEKEAKTKAYSKEGLMNAAKADRDPKEKAKNEVRKWVRGFISQLHIQIDQLESTVEQLSSKKKGRDAQRIANLEETASNHQFHIDKMEILMRRLDNDEISAEQITDLKDDIEYYVDSNQDEDCFFDDSLYEELIPDKSMTAAELGKPKSSGSSKHDEPDPSPKVTSAPAPSAYDEPLISSNALRVPKKKEEKKAADTKAKSAAASTKESKAAAKAQASSKTAPGNNSSGPPAGTGGKVLAGAGVGNVTSSSNPSAAATGPAGRGGKQVGAGIGVQGGPGAAGRGGPVSGSANTAAPITTPAAAGRNGQQQPPGMGPRPGSPPGGASSGAVSGSATAATGATAAPAAAAAGGGGAGVANAVAGTGTGVVAGADGDDWEVNEKQRRYQSMMMKSSFVHIPEPREADGRVPAPRTPYRTPPSYPRVPHPIIDNPSIYRKLDVDTLFYIFYHQQGTYPQYLAAKELKRQSWRFHKKYLTWFKRHDEPKVTTEDYEQGTYVYFDHENGWCQRVKRDFTFEYVYLEDTLTL